MKYRINTGCLIDGVGGQKKRAQIDIENKKIIKISEYKQDGDDFEKIGKNDLKIINAQQYTVLPGLIDTHIHLSMDPSPEFVGCWESCLDGKREEVILKGAKNAETMLLNGITSARDCGAYGDLSFLLREMIQKEVIRGPKLMISGNPITITGGHCHYMGLEADDKKEVIKAVRLMNKYGADFIKIMATGGRLTPGSNPRLAQYDLEEIKAVVQEAHKRNMKVASHALGVEGIIYSVHAGVDTIAHFACLGPLEGFDQCDDLFPEIAERNIFIEPTLPASAQATKFSSVSGEGFFERRIETVKKLHQLGVKMIAGTDAGIPNIDFTQLSYSMKLFAEYAGFTNYEALQTGTINAACALGIEKEVGSIEEGKIADLLVIEGDPLQDLNHLKNIVMVFKEGKLEYSAN